MYESHGGSIYNYLLWMTKDPEATPVPELATPSSPKRTMTPFEMSRYLDYCSELLSLTSKLAAFHAQYLRDHVILSAVNDVEALTTGLTHKIWQKIMILDTEPIRMAAAPRPTDASGKSPSRPAASTRTARD